MLRHTEHHTTTPSPGQNDPGPTIEKARHPLPVMIQGERGLREGEVWMVDEQRLWFWTGEHFARNNIYEARVDLRAHGDNADIVVKITQVIVGQSSGVKQGYLHTARYRAKRTGDTRQLLEAFRKLNPDRAPTASAPPPRAAPRPAPPQAKLRENPQRAQPEPASRPGRTNAAHPAPASPPRDRRAGQAPIHQVVPLVGPGSPASVLLHFPDAGILRTHIRVETGDLFLYAAPAPGLVERQGVQLHLQLPTGAFLTLLARVTESTGRRCSFVARRADAAILNTIAAAL